MTARILAIGDVHGCADALWTLLDAVRPSVDDRLVFLGDLVDRGPDTRGVLELVLDWQRRCRVTVIQGNHEEMMLSALDGNGWGSWMMFGGEEALESYGGDQRDIPESHVELLQAAVDYWETPETIFVHANLQPGVPLIEQDQWSLRWTHLNGRERPYETGRRVVCGHTPQQSGLPFVRPGWVCIDTNCQRGGWLTAFDVEADWCYQADEAGRVRDFALGAQPEG